MAPRNFMLRQLYASKKTTKYGQWPLYLVAPAVSRASCLRSSDTYPTDNAQDCRATLGLDGSETRPYTSFARKSASSTGNSAEKDRGSPVRGW